MEEEEGGGSVSEDSHVVESNENERQWMHQLPSVVHSIETDIAMVSKFYFIYYYVLANYLLMNCFRGD